MSCHLGKTVHVVCRHSENRHICGKKKKKVVILTTSAFSKQAIMWPVSMATLFSCHSDVTYFLFHFNQVVLTIVTSSFKQLFQEKHISLNVTRFGILKTKAGCGLICCHGDNTFIPDVLMTCIYRHKLETRLSQHLSTSCASLWPPHSLHDFSKAASPLGGSSEPEWVPPMIMAQWLHDKMNRCHASV